MYIYLIQPDGLNSNIYKIGMSKKQDLSRLKSYKKTTRYIRMAEIGYRYKEAENELILLFNQSFSLESGREYFRLESAGDELKAINIFTQICNKYFSHHQENITSNIMSTIAEFDFWLEEGVSKLYDEHKICIDRNDLRCEHVKYNFKLSGIKVVAALIKTLMDSSKDIITTTEITTTEIETFNRGKLILFKPSDRLCNKESLNFLFYKSKHFDRINIDNVLEELKTTKEFFVYYDEYERIIKTKAKKINIKRS